MGLAASTGKDNDEMVDNMIDSELIHQKDVEVAFRLVDRARFFPDDERENAYKDTAWKSKTGGPGRLHISAPCIYANVVEHLQLKRGHSFLNLGSGTGYLNTVVGYLIGTNGCNHGIEMHENIVNYAIERVTETLKTDEFAAFDWCVPQFFCGNALNIDSSCYLRYDRVYCGAAVSEPYQLLLCCLLKVGGVCVMPFQDQVRPSRMQKLQRITRISEDRFEVRNITSVSFADFQIPTREELQKEQPVLLPEVKQQTLQEQCRDRIRACIREKVLKEVTLKIRQNTSGSSDDYQQPTGNVHVLRLEDRSPPVGGFQDQRPSINVHQRAPAPIPRNADQELEEEAPQHLMAIFGEDVETDANGNAVVVRPQLPQLIQAMNERVIEMGGLHRREERLPDGSARIRPFLPGNAGEATIAFDEEFMVPVRRFVPRQPRQFNMGDPVQREERNRQLVAIRNQIRQNHQNLAREHQRHFEEVMRRNGGRPLPAPPRISMEQAYALFREHPGGGANPEQEGLPGPQAPPRARNRRLPEADIDNGLAAEDVRANEDDLPLFPDEGPPPEEEPEAIDDDRLMRPLDVEALMNLDGSFDQEGTEPVRPPTNEEERELDNRLGAIRDQIRSMRRMRTHEGGRTRAARPVDAEMRERRDELFTDLLRQRREAQRLPVVRPIITSDVPGSSSSSSSTASSSSGRSSVKRPRSGSESGRETKQQRRSPSTSGNEDEATITEQEEPVERVDVDMEMEQESIHSSVTSAASSSSGSSSTGTERDRDTSFEAVRPRNRTRRFTANRRPVQSENEAPPDTAARDQAHEEQIESVRLFREKFDNTVSTNFTNLHRCSPLQSS
ncbi:hypothetical protein QR680_009092 [Steinernema hermaphroditum]|uniref:Protein-L-isoaspartate O-methyltransferase domain-containing protein 1 n=1 Tax=Steinernema hermaphroditum TaxID=289476 RepID=A0AA39M994_9BILA|nr:hypothetical protein QR680_009092 [Steinernema hermaphroditum]